MISRSKYRHFWHGNQGNPYHGASTATTELQLVAGGRIYASASRDPDGQHFLIALLELHQHNETSAS
jgi:hypothetical protein